jgi:hypothetical protein
MNYRHFKYEGWLYGLAFLLAIALRLIGLGHMPLNDSEASLALQSLQLASGLKPVLDPHPAYILFTAPLFFLYGGGMNALARLVPALVGSALVFAPLLFQDRIKPRPGLILAFFIALDPGLVAISRQAGSPILAITFVIFAFGFLNKNNFRWSGIFAALALLSGPSIWAGVAGLVLSLAIYQAAKLRFSERDDSFSLWMNAPDRNEFLISLAATLLLAGTLFFLIPNGLSAALASIPAYLRGWSAVPLSGWRAAVPTMNSLWLLISLLAYQPFPLLLAIMAIIRGWVTPSHRIVPLSVWFFVSLLLALFYPARQMADLAWMLIPLYAMAALELARFMDVSPEDRMETMGATLLIAFLWVFGWVNFTSMVWSVPGDASFNQRGILVMGSIILLILSIMLVAFGWSVRIAQLGLIWGLGISLGILSLAGALGSTGLRGTSNPELWWPQRVPMQADLLVSTINDLSEWKTGDDDALPIVIVGIDSPALEWALREHSPKVANFFDASQPPSLIISAFELDPNTIAPYRGQDFIWRFTTTWEVAQARDWFKWLAYREMPQTTENTILWATDDLFINADP